MYNSWMSRSLVHVLLSLLLLVSQQLSLGHAYSHWTDVRESLTQQAGSDGGSKPSKPGLHEQCGQCAASAQVAFALPATVRQFIPAELAYAVPSLAATPGVCLLAACPFQQRGPPLA
jgi:multidrug transporter EmrE-like cation transporter